MFRHDLSRTGSSDASGIPLEGELKWVFATGAPIHSSPAVDGTVYVGSRDSKLYALDTATGAQLWHITTGDKITSSPAVAGGTVYVGSHDGNLYAVE